MRERERERENYRIQRERENSNLNSKTLFYKDCSLGSVKKPLQQLVLAKLFMSKYKITDIL